MKTAIGVMVVLSVFLIVVFHIRIDAAGHSWNLPHECSDGRTLSDEEFVIEAVSQSLRRAPDSPYFIAGTRMQSGIQFAEDFISENPNCCEIYNGDPKDHFSPPDYLQFIFGTIAKVVKINFTKQDFVDDKFVGRPAIYYARLDACGNQLD